MTLAPETAAQAAKQGTAKRTDSPESNAEKDLRVLLVCSKYLPEYAGSGLRAHRTYKRLMQRYAVDVEVICSSMVHESWKNESYAVEDFHVTRISSPFKQRLVRAARHNWKFRKLLWYLLCGIDEGMRTLMALVRMDKQIDVVHTFGHCWSGGVAAIWAGIRNKPILRELVTMESRPDDPPGIRPLVRWALRRCGIIIAISPLLANRAKQLGYRRVWCRPNPVDEDRFQVNHEQRIALRRQHTPFDEEDIVLVDLSKYSKLKNKDLLVRMMPLLPSRYKLVLAGPLEPSDEPLKRYLENLVDVLELKDRVFLTHGFVENPQHYLQMADVFLFPSLSDGLGTPVLEAICCGIPVVVHRLPGVTDWWIEEGKNGVLCPANPYDFAKGVERASQIPLPVVREAARKMLEQAKTESIDSIYYDYLMSRGPTQ